MVNDNTTMKPDIWKKEEIIENNANKSCYGISSTVYTYINGEWTLIEDWYFCQMPVSTTR